MEKKIIKFKSERSNYLKEKSGRKPNTARRVDSDKRFNLLHFWDQDKNFDLWVRMSCTELKESFWRQVKDVTFFDGYVIISWRD